MALPVISNNNPSAGSISWTAFALTFNGVSYPISAGNSAFKFIYWQYNAGVPAIVGTNTLPQLAAEDLLLFLNKGGVGVLVPTTDVLDGHLIVSGSILADAIGANQINATHIVANAITADELAAGAVTATHVAAGAITTDKLGVGTVSDSLVTNGSFEEFANGMPIGWTAAVANGPGSVDIVTGVASSGTNALRMVVGSTTTYVDVSQTAANFIPVTSGAGRKWYIGAMIGAGTATTGGLYLRALWFDASKNYLSYADVIDSAGVSIASRPITTAFQLFGGQVTPPSTARYMSVNVVVASTNVTTNVYVDELVAREVVISAQIGDGAITAPKILAGTITADRIAAGAITTDRLAISDFSNYASGGGFDTAADLANWTVGTGISVLLTDRYSGVGCLQSVANAATRFLGLKHGVPVVPGEQYFVRYYFKSTSDWNGTTGNSKLRIGDQANTVKLSMTYSGPSTSWVVRNLVFTIPTGMTEMNIQLYFDHTVGTAWIDELQIRRMNAGELIVDGAVIASKIATDAVSADKIIANAVTADKIAANAVTADKISANAVTASKILAGSITANKLQIGGATNALPDPSFMNPDITSARLARSSSAGVWTVGTPTASGIPTLACATAGSNNQFHYSAYTPATGLAGNGIQVTAGQKWYLAVDVETSASAGVRWNIYSYKADGTVVYTLLSPYDTGSGKRTLSYTYTVPAGVVAMELGLACNTAGVTWTIYGNAIVALQTSATLIEDGAITSSKITATAIDGKTITGATVQTAATGARIVLNSSGLNGWDANNVNYLTANSSGLTVTGTLSAIGDGWDLAEPNALLRSRVVTATLGGQAMNSGLTTEQAPQPPAFVPGLSFTNATELANSTRRSGVKSIDGFELTLQSGTTTTRNKWGYMQLSESGISMGTQGTNTQINVSTSKVQVTGVVDATEFRVGGVTMPKTDISYYESTGSKANFDALNQGTGTPVYQSGPSTTNLATTGAGQLTVTSAGIYSVTVTFRMYNDSAMTSGRAATGRSFIDVSNANNDTYSRTSLPVQEDQVTGGHPSLKLAANDVLKFNILQTSGGLAYYKIQIWLTRIG